MSITHVCLSDLHFGSETSLLTDLGPDRRPRYLEASPVLSRLMSFLEVVVSAGRGTERPKLVLGGDVLELALAETHEAAMSFDRFLTLAFPGGDRDLFDREILLVPGNHDHHLWEMAREQHYLNYLRTVPAGHPLGQEWHITRLYPAGGEDFPEQRLLNGLAARHPSLQGVRFRAAYPNYGLRSADGARSVIFTHGHFVEPLYTLMSELKRALFPDRQHGASVLQLEQENFAWIDFFWSTMGRSGDAGVDVQRIYEMQGTAAGRKDLSRSLASAVVEHFFSNNWIPDTAERLVFDRLFEALFERSASRERMHAGDLLSPDAERGLQAYLAGPLLGQVSRECRDTRVPETVSLVFGHTHKPFERAQHVPGYARPLDVYNTGGWVVDTVTPEPVHGGAIVMVDDQYHCASLRMYNEPTPGRLPTAVRVAAVTPNPLSQALEDILGRSTTVAAAQAFSEAVTSGVTLRARALAERAR